MGTLRTIALAAGVVALFAACNGQQKDGKQKADSANKTLDSTNKSNPTTDREISGPDAKFAVEAANGGMSEVMLGNLAKQKATNPKVKDFGDMMVMDHTKANDKMKQIAAAKKITLPDSVASEEKKLIADLSEKKGAAFDTAYVNAMVDDHKADIKAFEEARKKVTYPELQAFIDKTLPVLHKHLDAIQKIHDQMKLQ